MFLKPYISKTLIFQTSIRDSAKDTLIFNFKSLKSKTLKLSKETTRVSTVVGGSHVIYMYVCVLGRKIEIDKNS